MAYRFPNINALNELTEMRKELKKNEIKQKLKHLMITN